jgi:hypothetical protein
MAGSNSEAPIPPTIAQNTLRSCALASSAGRSTAHQTPEVAFPAHRATPMKRSEGVNDPCDSSSPVADEGSGPKVFGVTAPRPPAKCPGVGYQLPAIPRGFARLCHADTMGGRRIRCVKPLSRWFPYPAGDRRPFLLAEATLRPGLHRPDTAGATAHDTIGSTGNVTVGIGQRRWRALPKTARRPGTSR